MSSGIKITKSAIEVPEQYGGRHLISIPAALMPIVRAYKEKLEKEIGMPLTFGQAIVHLINKENK